MTKLTKESSEIQILFQIIEKIKMSDASMSNGTILTAVPKFENPSTEILMLIVMTDEFERTM